MSEVDFMGHSLELFRLGLRKRSNRLIGEKRLRVVNELAPLARTGGEADNVKQTGRSDSDRSVRFEDGLLGTTWGALRTDLRAGRDAHRQVLPRNLAGDSRPSHGCWKDRKS